MGDYQGELLSQRQVDARYEGGEMTAEDEEWRASRLARGISMNGDYVVRVRSLFSHALLLSVLALFSCAALCSLFFHACSVLALFSCAAVHCARRVAQPRPRSQQKMLLIDCRVRGPELALGLKWNSLEVDFPCRTRIPFWDVNSLLGRELPSRT